ncbi:MAG: sulfotransferase [Microthrixaceae bacterium]
MGQVGKLDACLIGAQKSGSSSLARWLADHPQVCHSKTKETHFWREQRSESEIADWFSEQFDDDGSRLLVESSTSNSMYPEVRGIPQRLRDHNPKMKILYVVRDPVRRTESHLVHSYRNGVIGSDWARAIANDAGFLNRSRYMMQLDQFLAVFPDEQIHVVIFENLIADPGGELDRIEDFLGVTGGPAELPRINVSAVRPGVTGLELALRRRGIRLPHRVRQALRRRFGRTEPTTVFNDTERSLIREELRPDTVRLGEYLGAELPWPTS